MTPRGPAKGKPGAWESTRRSTATGLCIVLALLTAKPSLADEGGNGMWLLGSYGSLAAVPYEPGVSVAALFYSGAGVLKDAPASGQSYAVYSALTYAFATPVLGGQLALSAIGAFGGFQVSIDNRIADSHSGFDDVTPVAALRWNAGVNNFLAYTLVNVPVGDYDPKRLVNPGLGHWTIDGGAGYTYFDPNTGYEFSTVAGLSYNFQNPSTLYRNGLNLHIEWGASKFVAGQLQIGAVGYFYQQLTPDQGQDPSLGDFKARVAAVGPQMGFMFPVSGLQGYVNLKGYREFAAQNRPEGWNVWLTLSFSPQAPKAAAIPQ